MNHVLDIVAHKNGAFRIIDAQVVNESTSLDGQIERKARRKVAKYNANNLKHALGEEYGVHASGVIVTSATLYSRGVWSRRSAETLAVLGLSSTLPGLTTRVFQGNSPNWNRFNKITTMAYRRTDIEK